MPTEAAPVRASGPAVYVIAGFLGSGKTTLLKRALAHELARGEKPAVLMNEFGAEPIDHLLVETIADDVVLLESGCICCTVRGELSRALKDLFLRRLRHGRELAHDMAVGHGVARSRHHVAGGDDQGGDA